jgi:uracil-DNA glycosylase
MDTDSASNSGKANTLAELHHQLCGCRRCPRLAQWREQVAITKRAAYRDQDYWGQPVAGFGDPQAHLLILGLAPGAHGANRTGRMFTGDSSGDFLYPALYRAGFALQSHSTSRDDGLTLHDCFITAAGRCVPPANKPSRDELANCQSWLTHELALLPNITTVLALGQVAHETWLRLVQLKAKDYPFKHAASYQHIGGVALFDSYHVSQQNTQTGRLTAQMFDALLATIKASLAAAPGEAAR